VITHDHAIAARMPRQITMLDGRITTDTAPASRATGSGEAAERLAPGQAPAPGQATYLAGAAVTTTPRIPPRPLATPKRRRCGPSDTKAPTMRSPVPQQRP